MRNEFGFFHKREHTQTNLYLIMKKIALLVGLAASLGFNNAQAVDLNWAGDVRYRYQTEKTDDGNPATTDISRNRHRGRLRLGANAWINEELSAGVQLATDDMSSTQYWATNETTSRNQTFGNTFHANSVFLNEYYIDYHPAMLSGDVNVILGKRAVASTLIVVNDLVWDSDLTFEGATLQYGKDAAGKEKDGLSAVIGYYPLNEMNGVANPGSPNKYDDAYLFATQASYKGEVSDINYQLGAAYYDYVNFDYNGMVLRGAMNYSGKDFNIVELFGKVGGQITDTLPWQINGQYAFNTAKNDGVRYTNIDENNRKSYLVEAKIGDAKQVGQWFTSAEYAYIEQDAVTGFTDSDRNRGSQTNLKGIKIGAAYHLVQNMTLGLNYFRFKNIIGNTLPTTQLLWVDATVKF